jgi:hypothetical protein
MATALKPMASHPHPIDHGALDFYFGVKWQLSSIAAKASYAGRDPFRSKSGSNRCPELFPAGQGGTAPSK